MTRNADLAGQLADDFRAAPLEDRQREMLRYAEKLTIEPWNMVEEDVVRLRGAGFTDRDILDINQVTSYYAYVNRTADGLGVGLE
ncbi:hypothetical protein BH23CHL2_BH23CHL2_17410 [soil metagenome]